MECCKKIKALLGDYLEGELDPELCRELESHLGHCDPCRVVVNTTERTVTFYRNLEPCPLPSEVKNRLLARLRRP